MNYTTEIFTIKNPRNSLRAYGSLVIEVNTSTKLKIKGFKIFDGTNGLFCKPPQTKSTDREGNDTWYDDVQFVDESEDNTFKTEVYSTFVKDYSKRTSGASKTTAAGAQSSYSDTATKTNSKPLW